jgi:hypothetical protein
MATVGAALGAGIAAFMGLKAAVDKVENAYAAQEEASAILRATLKATGADAWISAEAVEGFASELQSVTKYGDETIIAMQNVLLGFRNIRGDNFKEATKQILNI